MHFRRPHDGFTLIVSNGALPGSGPGAELAPPTGAHPRPEWLKVRFFGGENYQDLKRIMRSFELHTVCESARCPNQGECWEHRTATFMILGEICTRACGFCAVPSGRPHWDRPTSPSLNAWRKPSQRMNLRYAVVTSVNRDDQADGGAAIFARTIAAIRERVPGLQGGSSRSGFSRRMAGPGGGGGRRV